MEDFKAIKTYKSKRNQVQLGYVDGKLIVRKKFKEKNKCKQERANYKLIKGKKPMLHMTTENCLFYDYLGENNLADFFYAQDSSIAKKIEARPIDLFDLMSKAKNFQEKEITDFLKKALDLIIQAVKEKTYFISDLNLRNFIEKDREIFVIDYEEAKEADEDMIITFLSFFLTNKPYLSDCKLSALRNLYENERISSTQLNRLEEKILHRVKTKKLKI